MLTLWARRAATVRSFSSLFSICNSSVADEELLLTTSQVGEAPPLLQPGVVVYDGVCHLCHRGVKWLTRVDKFKKIKFCALQSKAAEPYLKVCGLDREDVLRRFLFVEGLGLYHQGSTAALKVLSYLPLPYFALSIFLIIPPPLRDAIYDYVARRRYDWFGKEEDCILVNDGDLLERFIDREEMVERLRKEFKYF